MHDPNSAIADDEEPARLSVPSFALVLSISLGIFNKN